MYFDQHHLILCVKYYNATLYSKFACWKNNDFKTKLFVIFGIFYLLILTNMAFCGITFLVYRETDMNKVK